jgi:hypothetical protein
VGKERSLTLFTISKNQNSDCTKDYIYSDVIYNAYNNNNNKKSPLRDFQKHLPATARKLKT